MRIGIDLGGTKIEGIVMDDAGTIIARVRISTPDDGYRAIIIAVADLIQLLEADAGQRCTVGVGIPGIISPHSNKVKNANTTILNGQPLDRDLMAALERPIRFENDANCFALSEAKDGAGQGAASVFGVIIGTGTGGGIVINSRILCGANAIGGEWGHNSLPWPKVSEMPGTMCYCGRRACIETYLSGSGLMRSYVALGGSEAQSVEQIVARLGSDQEADLAMDVYESQLTRALASVINLLDPEVIVLGGGLSNIQRIYPAVRKSLANYVFSDHIKTEIRRAKHGDSSGVRGAARLWDADPE